MADASSTAAAGSQQLTYDVNTLVVEDFFNYSPSLSLAIIALVLFTLAAAVLAVMTERRKVYRFMHTITLTGLLEAGGYAALIYCIEQSGKSSIFNAYVAQQVLVVLSPNVIQAGMYWQLGLILAFSPALTRGRKALRGWVVTTFFVSADVLALTVQAVGISIWASSQASGTPDQGQIKLGCGITLGGLVLQILFFACFASLTIWTHRHPNNGLVGSGKTRRLFIGLYTAMVFLTIRNVFRLVEFAQNTVLDWPPPSGTFVLSESQVLFYCLDTLPILLVFASYLLFHPGYLLPAGGPPPRPAASAVAPATDVEAAAAAPLGKAGASGESSAEGQGAFKVAVV